MGYGNPSMEHNMKLKSEKKLYPVSKLVQSTASAVAVAVVA